MFPQTSGFGFNDPDDQHLTVETAQFDGMQMNRVISSGHWIRLSEDDRATYLVPRRGAVEVETIDGSFSGQAGTSFVFSPNTRTTKVVPTGAQRFRASVLLVDVRELRKFLSPDAIAAGSDYVERCFVRRSAPLEERALRDYIIFLERELLTRPLAFSNPRVQHGASALARELFGQLFLGLQSDSTELPADGGLDLAYVKRAEEFMDARLDEPLTVSQIAAYTGVSVRRLQLIFQKRRQSTPREVLTQFRLQKVHELLVDSHFQLTVFQAALDCGFTHLGRFAAAYKARFGELPSETLGKTRKRSSE